jgi:VIT1/CCC1 family predicted Fe2+/Mn2+ transporter
MGGRIAYWVSTSIVGAMMLFSSLSYLSGSVQVVNGFAHLGYPPHLRIILGIAKLAGAIVLIVPGFRLLKEWAYAGLTFAFVIATVAHYSAGDGPKSVMPVVLLGLLIVSYVTRPPSRRLALSTATPA